MFAFFEALEHVKFFGSESLCAVRTFLQSGAIRMYVRSKPQAYGTQRSRAAHHNRPGYRLFVNILGLRPITIRASLHDNECVEVPNQHGKKWQRGVCHRNGNALGRNVAGADGHAFTVSHSQPAQNIVIGQPAGLLRLTELGRSILNTAPVFQWFCCTATAP
jgi:hypothetical protein